MFKIEQLKDNQKWDNLVSQSENNNIFLKSFYLDCLSDDKKYFTIKKRDELISAFVVIKDKKNNVVENLFAIHSGIIFFKNKKMKTSSHHSQNFQILEFYQNFLNKNYKNIYVPLSPEINDIRPFQWYNYNLTFKDKYSIDIKYTSYLNLENFDVNNEFNSDLFSNLNETRKRYIRYGYKNSIDFIELDENAFLELYIKNIETQKININKSQLIEMENIIRSLKKIEKLKIFCSKISNQIEYAVAVCWDDNKSYYLFGTGAKERQHFSSTATFWHAIKFLKNQNIKFFDLEGINSPNRGSFKVSFGGSITPYYVLKFIVS